MSLTNLALGNVQWATGTQYSVGQIVWSSGYPVTCLVAHTASASFITDSQAGYWQMAVPMKNYADNSGFNFWQRGNSISYPGGSPAYVSDRWRMQTGIGGFTCSWSQTLASSSNARSTYCARFQMTSATTASGGNYFLQPKESADISALFGKTVTISLVARSNQSGQGINAGIVYTNTLNDSGTNIGNGTAVGGTQQTPTGSFTKFVFVVSVPSSSIQSLGFQINLLCSSMTTGSYIDLTDIMVNEGPAPAPYQPAGANLQAELAMCQRYYEVWQGRVVAGNVSAAYLCSNWAVVKRAAPTVTLVGNYFNCTNGSNPGVTVSTYDNVQTWGMSDINATTGVLTTGQLYEIGPRGGGYLTVNAEL